MVTHYELYFIDVAVSDLPHHSITQGTFDANDVKFFDLINVASWDIGRHSINFVVKVKDEKELDDVTRKVIGKYFD